MPLPRSVALFNKRYANRLVRPIARIVPFLAVIHHVGRLSGREYAIPVNIFRDGNDIIVPLTYSSDTDWVKNVLAAEWCEIETGRKRMRTQRVRLETDHDKRWAPGVIKVFLNRLGVHEIMRFSVA